MVKTKTVTATIVVAAAVLAVVYLLPTGKMSTTNDQHSVYISVDFTPDVRFDAIGLVNARIKVGTEEELVRGMDTSPLIRLRYVPPGTRIKVVAGQNNGDLLRCIINQNNRPPIERKIHGRGSVTCEYVVT